MPIEKWSAADFFNCFQAYVQLSSTVVDMIRNPDALAIHAYLLNRPEDWDVREKQIRDHFGISKKRYQKAVRDLKELYLWRSEKIRNRNAMCGTRHHIYPVPICPKTGLVLLEDNERILEKISDEYSAKEMGLNTSRRRANRELASPANSITYSGS